MQPFQLFIHFKFVLTLKLEQVQTEVYVLEMKTRNYGNFITPSIGNSKKRENFHLQKL
jgi:hypothetical protein